MERASVARASSSSPDLQMDGSPLLQSGEIGNGNGNGRSSAATAAPAHRGGGGGLLGAARFLRRAGSRRMMREPSMLVRETAAEQLEERQSDWAYSKPVVILDFIWNLAFVIVALVVLGLSRQERPSTPLRVWVAGYALQCILHMICVCSEYQRRNQPRPPSYVPAAIVASHGGLGDQYSNIRSPDDRASEIDGDQSSEDEDNPAGNTSLAKRLESANTMFSFVWWIVGFYWITAGGQAVIQEAPCLYWLCVVFLAFDVLFVIFCVALACVIGIAVCCCLPCIIAILYAVADQEGASEDDISTLPKFKFRRTGSFDKSTGEKTGPSRGVMSLIGSPTSPREQLLTAENAECCICLSAYDDGVELRELPCGHHFHCTCIDKWLRINATCPLCKFNIIKSSNTGREDA